MTNDHKSGYAIKNEVDSNYKPEERQEGENESVNEADLSIVAQSQYVKGLGVKGTRDKYGREIPDTTKYLYTYVDWRPVNEHETLIECHEAGRGRNTRFRTFVDNPP